MKKKRIYNILYGIMAAMAPYDSARKKAEEKEQPLPLPVVMPAAPVPVPAGHSEPLVGEESHEQSPAEPVLTGHSEPLVGEESHEQSPTEPVAEEEAEPVEDGVAEEEPEADFVEGDSSVAAFPQNDEEEALPQNDEEEALPQNDESDTGHSEPLAGEESHEQSPTEPVAEEESEPAEEGEEIDYQTPTADGLRFEWREGTKSYAVTGLADQNGTQALIPARLFDFPVTEIAESSFRGCRFLTQVVVPEGVTAIGDRAFYGCYALERVELPESLTRIGDEVFYLCMAITSLNEYDNAYYLGNRRNPYLLLSVHKSREVDACRIHERTKFIDRGAFAECRSLTEIAVPDGVKGIGCKAFYGCVSLKKATLGRGLSYVADSAFYGCDGLSSVEYAGSQESWRRVQIAENNEPLKKAFVKFRTTF